MTEGPQPVGIDAVEAAAALLEGQVEHTPLRHSRTLSDLTGAELWLKFENLQYTASFKERGALNKLASLDPAERARGVVAMSAGNHAQGVAYHAARLGIRATIVMPETTPFSKIHNTEQLGARVELQGETVDEAARHARTLERDQGLVFIHPFDDPLIIAGQGTIGLEIAADAPALDALVVPIGGGGLISGIATALADRRPDMEVIGVQSRAYPALYNHRFAKSLPLAAGRTIADGISVKEPGRLTRAIIDRLVADIVLVDEPHLEQAILQLLEIEKTVVEGAGAAGLAAVLADPGRFRGRRVGLVLTGGNIDSRLLSAVIMRGLVRSERLIRLAVMVPDSPGSLARLTRLIADARGNVVEVTHKRAFSRGSVRDAIVDFVIETRDARHATQIEAALAAAGFRVELTERGGPGFA
ncbi:MAG: threonine ammonia-lyase [Geminicoccaceae bacterium]